MPLVKKHILAIVVLFTLAVSLEAQVPHAINYQAIARDGSGGIIANRNISLRVTINSGLNPGFPEYRETHTALTNQFGLFTLKVGLGTPVFGSFNAIDWPSGNKYILVELDMNGGTNYLNMGSTQLLSV